MARPERHVAKDGSVTWKVRFRYRSKQTSETFRAKRDAEQFALWLRALGPQGALDQLYEAERQATVPTLDELAADHIVHRPAITAGTAMTYTRLWERTWGPHLGRLPANQVTEDAVIQAVKALAQTYSHKSLQNQRGLLAGVLDRAISKGYLHDNPAKGLPLPRGGEADRVEMRLITPEEWLEVEAAVAEHYRPFVRFLAGTGCRWGEAVALEVGDVALPNVRIRRALKWSPDNRRVVGPTKTKKSNRTVVVPPDIRDELREACLGKKRTDLVYTAPKGGPILHRTFWSRVWLPAVKDLDPPRPRIHDLRHSHVSWLLAAGVPIHIVQARLGHTSIKTTVDTYGHLMPDAQLAAADAAGAVFGGMRALDTN